MTNGLDNILDKASSYVSLEDYPPIFELKESEETWYEFCKKIKELRLKHSSYMHDSYLEGLENLAYSEYAIPSLDRLSNCLARWGWRAIWVNGYIPTGIYTSLIASGYFPIACTIRRKIFLDHSPGPDFIHDVWGHLPLLCNPTYSLYIKEIAAAIANSETNEFDQALYEAEAKTSHLKHMMVSPSSNEFSSAQQSLAHAQTMANTYPSQQMQLARMFLWSIEFGLMESTPKSLKIIGAGILSAPLEYLNIVEGKAKLKPYSKQVIDCSFTYFSALQPEFFVINNFQCWQDILRAYLEENWQNADAILA
jgi:phenylalanine-4-hydroxylase